MLERPGQAAQAAMLGDLPGAWRAMFQPAEMTSAERDAFLQKLGLDKGPYARVYRMLTNPLLIVTLALSYKFPVPTAQNIFKLSERVGSLTSRFPVLGRLTSMQALFRGTAVPDDLGKIIRDVADFRSEFGGKYGAVLTKFKQATGRYPNHREQVMVSAWLDGLHKGVRGFAGKAGDLRIGSGETTRVLPGVKALFPHLEQRMGPATLQLAKDTRGVLDEMWGRAFGELEGRKRILQAIARQRKAGFTDETTEAMAAYIRDPKKIADYFPRRIIQTEEDFRRLMAMMTDSASVKRYAQAATKKTQAWATPETYRRKGVMLPSREDLEVVKDLVDPKELAKLDAIAKARVLHKARLAGLPSGSVRRLDGLSWTELKEAYPKVLQPGEARLVAGAMAEAVPRQYSLRLMSVLSSYTHTLAGTYGWTVRGGGERMMGHLTDLRAAGRAGNVYAKARADMLENTYVPLAMGRGTFRQALKAQAWDQSMLQLSAWMDSPKVSGLLGPSLTKRLKEGLEGSRGSFSLMNLQRKAAGYFYLSTLGLNPGSALKNTLQLVLTTGPTIGYRTTAAGLERAMRRSHKYFALRMGPRKLGHETALREVYPEFAKAGLVAAPVTDLAVQNSLRNAYEVASLPTGKFAKVSEKIQRGMMSLFTASETTVRLATFEAGMLHAARAKMPVDAAIEFSRKLVEQTQFLTGPQNTPFFLVDKGPLVRQLAQFPLRMLEFATSTALTLGSGGIDPKTGKPMNILGYNPGTFARMIAGSIIAMELGDAMGVNMGDALLGGALPTFTPVGKIGAPLPVIPPFFQLTGAAAAGLPTGDFSELMRSTPLLVPGGVELFKIMGMVPPGFPGSQIGVEAAKTLERTYADYHGRTPDGRIPVYSGKGTLRGYYTPWELVRYGLGIRGGDMDAEQELLRTLVKNRDQLRESRAQYLDARLRNAAGEAEEIAREFKQRFGFDLPVSDQDMEAMQVRRRITRLEQVVRTLPPGPARDQMIQLIATTLGSAGESLLGIDPMLLGQPSRQRETARGRALGLRAHPAFHPDQLGPTETVNPQTIGRQPGVSILQSP